jgi:transketolase
MALANTTGPTALILTRQNLEVFPKADAQWESTIKTGAYIAKDSDVAPEIVIIATGSEVNLALSACKQTEQKKIRVISMICPGLFQSQPESVQRKLIPAGVKTLIIEAGTSFGWQGFAGNQGQIISVDNFGACGPCEQLADKLGFSVSNVTVKIQKLLA